MSLKCFIGYDPRQPVAFQVCAQSVWEHASKPVEIIRLDLRTLPIKRRGLTEFTYSRFLVPYLCGFQRGRAVFLDSDMMVRADICELFDMDIPALQDVATVPGSLKFEWSSMMLFENSECENLTPEYIESSPMFDFAWSYGRANLPDEWNHLVGYDTPNPNAKIVHFTQGIPVWRETKDCEFAKEWFDTFRRMNSTVSFQELMGRSVHIPHMAGAK